MLEHMSVVASSARKSESSLWAKALGHVPLQLFQPVLNPLQNTASQLQECLIRISNSSSTVDAELMQNCDQCLRDVHHEYDIRV